MTFVVKRIRDPFRPGERQRDFIRAANSKRFTHVGYGGSIRAGKTQAGGRQIAAWAWQFPADYLVIRKTFPRLRDSTRKAMVHGDGGLAPCIHPDMIAKGGLRISDNEVVLRTGGVVKFRHAENPEEAIEAFKNMTLGGYLIDQVEELDGPMYEELFNTLEGRLNAPGTPQTGLTIANPGPEDHWYHRRVVDPATRDDGAEYVHTTLFENMDNLGEKYVQRMLATKETRPDWYKRYILGEWGAFGGKRFKIWNPKIHVCPAFEIPKSWTVIEAGDYGWSNAFAWLWLAIDPWNLWYVIAEHYEKEMQIRDHAAAIKATRERLGVSPSAIWFDPSGWANRGEYESPAMELFEHGILVAKAQNDRLGGWDRIEKYLSTLVQDPLAPPDEERRVCQLRIFDTCRNLIRELPNLRIKEGTDDVEKINDHAPDALRYGVASRPAVPPEEEKDAVDDMIERKLERNRRLEQEDLYHTV